MLLIDDLLLAPINGFKFILGQIQKLADQELNDDTVIKEQLLELQMRLELDEVSEDEFRVREAELFARLRAIKIGDRLVEITQQRGAKLIGYEMDASAALEKFRVAHRTVLGEIAERGTLLDETDINELLNLSLPGMDEVMALFELSELDRAGTYSRIVVDTAPSGHTSRLLRLPDVFSQMVNALDRMADKHRYIVAHFSRRAARQDEVDLFLVDLSHRIEQ